jgi:hypothetical protein
MYEAGKSLLQESSLLEYNAVQSGKGNLNFRGIYRLHV